MSETPYDTYTQKSSLFLYPLLHIKRGIDTKAVATYMMWEDKYTLEDRKLITIHRLREDNDFKIFKEVKLCGNRLFEQSFEIESEIPEKRFGAFVFDMSDYAENYDKIVKGKYSTISADHKDDIMRFFHSNNNREQWKNIRHYLYPNRADDIYEQYARHLAPDIKDVPKIEAYLKEIGEVCPAPNFEKETLHASAKIMNFAGIPLDLQE